MSPRGDWIFVGLGTGEGFTGWGEASHGFGFRQASAEANAKMQAELERLFERLRGRSPFDVEAFRRDAWAETAQGGIASATAFSALEQAMWDLAGKTLGTPVYRLLGGALLEALPLYANINRSVWERTPKEFARQAERAVEAGFQAVKLAPFDDFSLEANGADQERLAELGLARVEAVRRAIGDEIELMVDCHEAFDPDLAIALAARLESSRLRWLEEPLAADWTAETADVRATIRQPLAAGELLFGREAFAPLVHRLEADVIMPDVKHCGGLLELKKIAAAAETAQVVVAPHNPSGPVATLATAHVAATLPNFVTIEYAWGEVDWRAELLDPPEPVRSGQLRLSEAPGFGFELNRETAALRR